jgi:hypothetical protein
MLLECAGDDAVMGQVVVEGPRVAVAKLERGGCFPLRVEAVAALQFVATSGGTQFVEQSAAAHGLELLVVADEHEPPMAPLAKATRRARAPVPIIPASSTMTVVPASNT